MEFIGKETNIEVGGKKYKLSRFTLAIQSKFVEWADSRLPDPIEAIRGKLDGFPLEIAKMLAEDAMQRDRLRKSFNNPDIQALMHTTEGLSKIIALLLQKHQPDLTDDEALQVFDEALVVYGPSRLAKVICEATGVYVDIKEGEGNFPRPTPATGGLAGHHEDSVQGVPASTVGNP